MGTHKRNYRHKHKKDRDTVRDWRVWENGTSRFRELVVALKEDSAEVYCQATGQEYNGPESFDILLFAMDRIEMLSWHGLSVTELTKKMGGMTPDSWAKIPLA